MLAAETTYRIPDPNKVEFAYDEEASGDGEKLIVCSLRIDGKETGLYVRIPKATDWVGDSPNSETLFDGVCAYIHAGWYHFGGTPLTSWPSRTLAIEGLARLARQKTLPAN